MRSSFGEWIKYVLEIGAALATICAIIFALQQYREAVADARINATLGYVSRFNSGFIIERFMRVYESWDKHADQLQSSDDPTQAQINFIKSNKLKWDAILLGDFFDQLYVCLTRKICDEALAITMLGRDIETTYVLTGRFLNSTAQPTGCGLRALFEVVHPRLKFSRSSPEEKRTNIPPHPQLPSDACPRF